MMSLVLGSESCHWFEHGDYCLHSRLPRLLAGAAGTSKESCHQFLLPSVLAVNADYPKGMKVKGFYVDITKKWYEFNGRRLHFCTAFCQR